MENHIVQKSVRSGNQVANAQTAMFRLMERENSKNTHSGVSNRADQVVVPASTYTCSVPAVSSNLTLETKPIDVGRRSPDGAVGKEFLSWVVTCDTLESPLIVPSALYTDFKALNEGDLDPPMVVSSLEEIDLRESQATSTRLPVTTTRRFQIPPAAVVMSTSKNITQVFGEYNRESIDNHKRYKTAQYKVKAARTGNGLSQRQRANAVKNSRDYKSWLFDQLTGVYPQAGLPISHNLHISEDILDKLKGITSGANINLSLDAEVITTMEKMTNAFKEMFHTATFTAGAASTVINNAANQISSTIDVAMSGISKIMWIVPLIGAAFYACHRLPAFATPAAIAAVGLILATLLPEGLWDYIKSFWPTKVETVESFDPSQSAYDSESEFDFEAQAGLLEPSTLGNIISMSLTYLTIGKKDPLNIVKGLMKEMPSYSRNVDSWTKLSGFMLQVVEHFVNFVRNKFGVGNISILQTGVKAVDSWCSRVMDVLNESHTGGDIMNPDMVELLCALRDEGRDLSNLYRFSKEVSPILHRYLGQLDELCRVCSAAMHSFKGGRPQPVVMAMTGKPGVGKSFLCKMLTTMVLKHIISPEKAKAMKYNFDSEVFMKGDSEYWNGYCAQLAAIMDDWGQKVPVAGGENDFIDLIRMANCWAFPLNFADLENKGKNFFKSQFILLTTNVTNIDNCQKVIVAPDAITRRINYGYELSVASAFAKGTELDFQKVTRYIEEHKKFPFEAWELRKYHFGIGNEGRVVNPVPIKLEDVILQVANSIKKNQEMFKENTDLVTFMLKDAYLADEAITKAAEHQVSAAGVVEPTITIELSENEITPQGGILEEAQFAARAVGEVFHDCQEACVEALDGLWFPKLDGYRVKFARLTTELREHNFELKDWVRGVLKNPIVQFLVSYAASMAIITLLKAAIAKVFSWFAAAPKKVVGLVNSFRKKGRVPDDVLAQAIDALEPTDFDEAQLTNDGTYEIAVKFTPEVLARAYHRLTGTKIQSNEPQKYRMKHVHINGKVVTESDIVRQGDGYGDDIANVCAKNLYQIRIEAPEGNQTLGQMLMVRGTAGIMPAHFITMIKEGIVGGHYDETAKVVCTSAHSNTMVIRYTIKQFLGFQRNNAVDRDCVAVNFESLRAHRDITKSFVLEADLKSLSNIRIRIDTVEGREHFVHRIRHMSAKRCDRLEYGSGPTSQVIAESFEYTGYTKCGDCGGLATLQEFPSNCGRRIIGMHVAGNEKTGIGFCNIISDRVLKTMLAPFNVPEEYFPQGESAITMVDAPIEGSFLGLNKSDKTHGMNPYSSLIKTPLHNAWGVNSKVPAKLGPFVNKVGEHIIPMAKAIEGYASPLLHFDKEKISAAAYHAFAPTREATKDTTKYERRILTFGEAVAGVPGTNINGIPRGTSPGYPHILEGNTSKRPFFGTEGDYTLDSEKAKEIEIEVERVIDDARRNIRNPHIYLDFLKDELRAPEKVQAGKSRLISASPMVYVIAFRRYFLAFTAAVQDTRIRNGVAVGINHYTEWDALAKRMKSKGKRCVAGDFKGFDTSEQPQIHWAILDEINNWYNDEPENARIRSILWLEVVHSRHFGGMNGKSDHFYQWNKSLSSGHPATSIINSFYGLILFNLCWADIMGETRASEFWDKVYACTYGDDNVLNIDEAETEKFNQATIAAAMRDYGMTYTNEKKDGEVTNTRTLDEISFLKRSFRFEPIANRYVGPIELDSALYTCYWGRSERNMVQNIQDNIEFSWFELALHEPEVWERYAPTMRTIYAERMGKEPAHYFTRASYLKQALDMVPFWDR